MRILVLGDVVGEPGRRLVEAYLPDLRRETGADLVVVNGENAAHGHGITDSIAREWFEKYGVDVITTGNHAFDVKNIEAYFRVEPRLIRPANHPLIPPATAGSNYTRPRGLRCSSSTSWAGCIWGPQTAPSAAWTPSSRRSGRT